MKPAVSIAVLAIASVATAACVLQGHKHVPAPAQSPRMAAVERGVAASERPPAPPISNVASAAKQSPAGIRDMLKDASDYFALATSILAQARAGDASAQYVLWQVHSWCYESSTGAFARAKSWNEAMVEATEMQVPIETAKRSYDLCHRFFYEDTSDLGDAMLWLQRATDQGYPLAQVTTAQLRISQDDLIRVQRAAGVFGSRDVQDGLGAMPPIGGDARPRDLVRAAVQSLDPAAIQQAAMVVNRFADPSVPPDRRLINAIAWIYVSCLRGADCSAYGAPDTSYCSPRDSHCTGVPRKLLDWVHNDVERLLARASEINAALNAKDWDTLGLGK